MMGLAEPPCIRNHTTQRRCAPITMTDLRDHDGPIRVITLAEIRSHATLEGELARLGSKLEDVKAQHDRSGAMLAAIQTEQAHAGSRLAAIQGDVTQSATKLATLHVGQEQGGSRLAAIQGDVAQSALKLASLQAGQEQSSTQLSSIRDNLTQSASNLGRIEAKQDQANTQLGAIRGEVIQAGAKAEALQVRQEQAGTELRAVHGKLDKADAKQDATNAKLDRLTWAIWGGGAFIGIGLTATVVVLFWHHASVVGARLFPVVNVQSSGPGLVGDALRAQQNVDAPEDIREVMVGDWPLPDASPQSGRAPQEQWMPSNPTPEQARPPCGPYPYEAQNGGCWLVVDKKPPCAPGLVRKGDKCYARVIAKPKPMSEPPPLAPETKPH